jgi:hypothetical protein
MIVGTYYNCRTLNECYRKFLHNINGFSDELVGTPEEIDYAIRNYVISNAA